MDERDWVSVGQHETHYAGGEDYNDANGEELLSTWVNLGEHAEVTSQANYSMRRNYDGANESHYEGTNPSGSSLTESPWLIHT